MADSREYLLPHGAPRTLFLLPALAILVALPALPQTPTPTPTDAQIPIAIIEDADSLNASDVTEPASSEQTSVPDIRAALSSEIAQMRADLADISRFSRWQDDLARIARTAPDEALRQRLPMKDCLASVLEPICADLTGLFKPEEGAE